MTCAMASTTPGGSASDPTPSPTSSSVGTLRRRIRDRVVVLGAALPHRIQRPRNAGLLHPTSVNLAHSRRGLTSGLEVGTTCYLDCEELLGNGRCVIAYRLALCV